MKLAVAFSSKGMEHTVMHRVARSINRQIKHKKTAEKLFF